MFERLKNWFNPRKPEKRALPVTSTLDPSEALLQLFGIPTSGLNIYSWDKFSRIFYKRNPVVYSCIQKLVKASKKIKYQLVVEGEDELPAKYKPLEEFLKRPNPDQSEDTYIDVFIQHIHIAGITFQLLRGGDVTDMPEGPRLNSLVQFRLLRPPDVQIEHTDFELQHYLWKGATKFQPDEVLSVNFPDPDDQFCGLSPLLACAVVVEAYNGLLNMMKTLFENGGIPPGLLQILSERNVDDDEMDNFMERFAKRFRRAAKAAVPLPILSETANYQELGQTATDMQVDELKRSMTREICNCLGVPSQLIGDPDTSKYSNLQEANKAFYLDTVIPIRMHEANEKNNWWIWPKFGREVTLGLDVSGVEALAADKNALTERLGKSGWMTLNEKREMDGLEEPVEGGDEILVPFNLVPLSAVAIDFEEDEPPPDEPDDEDTDRSITGINKRSEQLPDNPIDPRSLYKTEAERRFSFIRTEKLRIKWEKKWVIELKKYFNEQRDLLIAEVAVLIPSRIQKRQDLPEDFVGRLFDESAQNHLLEIALKPIQVRTVFRFGEAAINELKIEGILFDVNRPGLQEFLATDLADRSRLINQTTATRLQSLINTALKEGQGAPEVTARIREQFGRINQARAIAIARTEVVRSSTLATIEGYKQAGVPEHEWLSARDADVRDTHQVLDGDVVPVGDDFHSPSGASGPGPGLLGDPAEDINCRCTLAPLGEGDEPI